MIQINDLSFSYGHMPVLEHITMKLEPGRIYGLLGDYKDMDMDFLRTLGPVRILKLEEIFGY